MRLGMVLLATLGLLGCRARSELLLIFATDLDIPAEVDVLNIKVSLPDQADRVVHNLAYALPSEAQLPGSLNLVGPEGEAQTVEVLAQLYNSDKLVVARTAVVSFVIGKSLELRIALDRSCKDLVCPDGETCSMGACRSVNIDPQELQPLSGALDAGVSSEADLRPGPDLLPSPDLSVSCGPALMGCEKPVNNDFNSSSAGWYSAGGECVFTTSTGELVITWSGLSDCGYGTTAALAKASDGFSAAVDLTGTVDPTSIETYQYFELRNPGNTNSIAFGLGAGLLHFQVFDKVMISGPTDVPGSPVPYDKTLHKRLRLSIKSGTAYWETSGDGACWVLRATAPLPPDMGMVNVAMGAGGVGTSASPAKFDNLSCL